MSEAKPQSDGVSSRELASWIVGSRELEVFKTDKRSKVWRITPAGMTRSLVIKRFEHGGFRQLVQHLLRMHPVQRELRSALALQKAGVPVVPPAGIGSAWDPEAFVLKYFIATPYAGPSLDRLMRGWRFTPVPVKIAVVNAVAYTAARLVLAGYFFKDLKTSNLVIDDEKSALLIDTGCARPASDPYAQLPRMLAMLDQTARRDGASRADRLRCLRVFCDVVAAGKGGKKLDPRQLAPQVLAARAG